MCKVNLILIIFKGMCECESVVVAGESNIFLFVIILEIWYICAYSMPSQVFLFLTSDRESKNSHSIIIEGITLWKIVNIEFDLFMRSCIPYPEEVPLSMSICVNVILQEHFILIIWDFYAC